MKNVSLAPGRGFGNMLLHLLPLFFYVWELAPTRFPILQLPLLLVFSCWLPSTLRLHSGYSLPQLSVMGLMEEKPGSQERIQLEQLLQICSAFKPWWRLPCPVWSGEAALVSL